ncbi:MAG: zf-HC2 domain-containing protein [Planctomycetota bacterium]|nr:MAG: zf-HC2 domain-containing protein [Planctomycetota bacterium]
MSLGPPAAAWPPRDCEEIQLWLNARLDAECTPAQEGWLAQHLQACVTCSVEWAELERTRLVFQTARLREPSDFEREALRRAIAPRVLQALGWAALCGGVLLLLGYGAWALAASHDVPLPMRLGLASLAAGALLLLGRYGWERRRVHRRDPYRDVLR